MKKLAVKSVLMDVDGTMTEFRENALPGKGPMKLLIDLIAEKEGIPEDEAEKKIRSAGDVANICLSEFFPALGVDREEYFTLFKEELSRQIFIPEDTVFFLHDMKERKIPIYSATTNSPFVTLAKLAVGGLADLKGTPFLAGFHPGNEFGDPMGKFSPHFFPNILQHHNYDPSTILMLGDEKERDLFPALSAGIRYGVIIDRKQKEDIQEKEGGIFVRSLKILAEMIE